MTHESQTFKAQQQHNSDVREHQKATSRQPQKKSEYKVRLPLGFGVGGLPRGAALGTGCTS